MKKYLLMTLFLAISVFLIAVLFFRGNAPKRLPQLKDLQIGTTRIRVEVADTEAKQNLGLSYRPALPRDHGMLFIFDKEGNYAFWMNGMNFPLDFIYLNDHKVVEVKENVPASDLTPFYPAEPVDAVVEVSAGFVKQNGVAVGQAATY
jgi:uncharacterized protein